MLMSTVATTSFRFLSDQVPRPSGSGRDVPEALRLLDPAMETRRGTRWPPHPAPRRHPTRPLPPPGPRPRRRTRGRPRRAPATPGPGPRTPPRHLGAHPPGSSPPRSNSKNTCAPVPAASPPRPAPPPPRPEGVATAPAAGGEGRSPDLPPRPRGCGQGGTRPRPQGVRRTWRFPGGSPVGKGGLWPLLGNRRFPRARPLGKGRPRSVDPPPRSRCPADHRTASLGAHPERWGCAFRGRVHPTRAHPHRPEREEWPTCKPEGAPRSLETPATDTVTTCSPQVPDGAPPGGATLPAPFPRIRAGGAPVTVPTGRDHRQGRTRSKVTPLQGA